MDEAKQERTMLWYAASLVDRFPEWKALKTIGVTLSYRQPKNGKESLEYRYYISSAALTKASLPKSIK